MRSDLFHLSSLIAVLALGLLPPCAAQDTDKIQLRFLSFPKSMEPVKLELRLSEEKSVAIEAPSNEFSKPLSIAPLAVWSVGETVQGPDGKPVFREFGRTQAPTSPQQVLVLIRKGAANSDGFDLLALDIGATAFGGGKFLFFNAAKVDIAGVVGEEKFMLKPDSHKIIQPKTESDKRTAHAMFYFRKGDEARPFFSSRWPVNARARSLVFFYHDPESKRIRMHTVRNFQ